MNGEKIVLPGGSGFLGRTLTRWYVAQGCEVIIFSRNPSPIEGADVVAWDGKNPGDWMEQLEGARAVVNLAGRSVNCRYNENNRRLMMNSRVDSTLVLGQAIAACATPPRVWLNSSTATIYRHRYDAPNTETTGLYGAEKEAKDAFSLEVAHAWEDAFTRAYAENDLQQTRGIVMRTAMVFGNEPGGVYATMRRLVRMGLGGSMAGGKQFVSWLHATDFCRAIDWLITNPDAAGIYNLTAPNPLTNQQMMAALRKANGIPIGLPATRWMLEIGAFILRTETELIFKSRRVTPERLLKEGFTFEFDRLDGALEDLGHSPGIGQELSS